MFREGSMVFVAFTSQGSIGVKILLGPWIETLEESERTPLSLFRPKK
jgi:hypothetical protein